MVLIDGVWIRRVGGENDPHAKVEVLLQLQDGWHRVAEEPLSANFSHCVGATGILRSELAFGKPDSKTLPCGCIAVKLAGGDWVEAHDQIVCTKVPA